MSHDGPHNILCSRHSSETKLFVSQLVDCSSATSKPATSQLLLLGNLLMKVVPTWEHLHRGLVFLLASMICNSHEPLATPSIIARVSIPQAWVVVQWCCCFNDSNWWDFPPPITISLVIGCSVRGRSHFCCGASSTVSSFFPSQL